MRRLVSLTIINASASGSKTDKAAVSLKVAPHAIPHRQ